MGRTADDYLKVWRSWNGYSEANGKYKEIIDIYNEEMPLPRGYKVGYQDAWCDVTVSAAAIKAGMTDLIGRECSCEEHVKRFQEKGIWIEDGNIIPHPGYLVAYNWNDGTQPNDGFSDHIGVVECVKGNRIICMEGNYKNVVTRREIPVGWGYIRGYAAPKYEEKAYAEYEHQEHLSQNEKDGHTEKSHLIQNEGNNKQELCKSIIQNGIVKVNSWLNVRKWARTSYDVCSFSPLGNGEEVGICDIVKDETGAVWYYIKYKGKYGFVHSRYVERQIGNTEKVF